MEKSCVTDVGDDKGRKERIVMREVRIVAEPFVFVSYLSVECVKELNEHGYIKIRGRIKRSEEPKMWPVIWGMRRRRHG